MNSYIPEYIYINELGVFMASQKMVSKISKLHRVRRVLFSLCGPVAVRVQLKDLTKGTLLASTSLK
jgi:hypothetical protein